MKSVLFSIIVLLILPFMILSAEDNSRPARPNIVFILADDLGWADTTLYGHTKFYKTPNIERLAKRGMTFTRAYTASPLCSPTRASILTGLHPARTGITVPNCHEAKVVLQAMPGTKGPRGSKSVGPIPPTRLNTTYYTLAEALKDSGYVTGHFGKWHLGPEPYSPLQQGFDVDVPHWPGPGPAGSYVAPWKFPDFDPDTPDQHIEDRMAKEAVEFLQKHKDEQFFLNYWMFSVHAPFDAKKDLIEKYRASVDKSDLQRCPTYAAMVESMDDAVGTLLDTLDGLGIADNTIIIFFSDNGGNMYNDVEGETPTSNRPLRGGKATMFEGGIRVPCIVSWPGIVKPETRSDALVSSCDFYPTILEMLGLKPQENQSFDGISILPALKGQVLERETVFVYFPHDPPVPDWIPPSVSVHQGDWKLIRIFYCGENGAHRWKLFNLRDDIGEKNDLASKEPDRVKQMDALIDGFLMDTKAVVPVPNPDFDPAAYHPEEEGKQKKRVIPKAKQEPEKDDPRLQGWKARNCTVTMKDGIVTMKSNGAMPFLGFGAGKRSGPAVVRIRTCSEKGGRGKVEWLSMPSNESNAKSVPFKLSRNKWEEILIDLPAEGHLGIVRVYLPAMQGQVQVDWIEMKSDKDEASRWDF